MTVEKFKTLAASLDDECDIDVLAFRWLRDCAVDYGKEGKVAKALLDQVKELMDI